ncbi:MAG: response regulator [Elusimicrobia bacterium]|nr:response regulator [Elusimicrobiota bacterium]
MEAGVSTGKRILVVDDDPTISLMLREFLSKRGYQVMTAIDGLDALSQIKSTKFDLVLLDIIMPNMDGIQVLQAIQDVPGCKNLPVMMMTGENLRGTITYTLKLNIRDYIHKPVSLPDLLAKVNAFFGVKI